ncbi:MAG: hypothetical protein II196_07425 [Spirochaetales bacterium]|nr:hypothetical protein [Spirochaetales bacterium]
MTITKNSLIIMMFLLSYKRSLAQSANSQQPTANSQQPTANSQQPTANSQQPTANSQKVIFTVIILYFVIYILRTRAVSDFFRLLFFYALLAVRLRSLTGRQKEILK